MGDSSSIELTPYLDPAYWDGRMVGQLDTDPITRRYGYGQNKQAAAAVDGYMRFRERPFPLDMLVTGDTIDADEHAPGTLFYANREYLRARHFVPPRVTGAGQEHPTDLGLSIPVLPTRWLDQLSSIVERQHMIETDRVQYVATRSFIVVTRIHRNKHALQPVNEAHLFRRPDGSIFDLGGLAPMDSPLTIGTTSHTKIGSAELLHRVNIAMLCREGEATPHVGLRDALARIMPGPQARH